MAAIGGEHRHVGIDPQRIIAPVPGSDHPAVEVEDAHQLLAIERGDWAPVPGARERRDDAQALFTFGCGCRAAFSASTSLPQLVNLVLELDDAARAPDRTSSPHGVP